jgi:hypothetical protein
VLTVERLKELHHYDPETGVWTRLKGVRGHAAGKPSGCYNNDGYLVIRIDGKLYYAHRLAYFYMTGELPHQVDHHNEVKTDNRFCNLRAATHAQNIHNRGKPRTNTSGLKGVHFYKSRKKWTAQLILNTKNIFLGYFNCPAAAHFAYQIAADVHHGEFARVA